MAATRGIGSASVVLLCGAFACVPASGLDNLVFGPASATGTDSGTSAGGGAVGDGGASATGGGTSGPMLPCGTDTCTAREICCVPWGSASSSYCGSDCMPSETQIYCHDASFCEPGAVCCASYDIGRMAFDPSDDHYLTLTCSSTCPPGTELAETQLIPTCVDAADCPGEACQTENMLPTGYMICKGS